VENSDGYPFGSAEEIAPVKGPEPNYHHLRGRASVVDCIVKIPSRRTVREDHSKLPLTTVKKRTFWWPESVTKIRQIAVLRGGQRAENVVEMTGFEPVTPALRTRSPYRMQISRYGNILALSITFVSSNFVS